MTYPLTRIREARQGTPARPRAVPMRGVVAGALAGALLLTFPAAGFARPVPGSFADLAAKVTPAVVTIATEQKVTPQAEGGEQMPMPFPKDSPFGEFFRKFMEQNPGFNAPGQHAQPQTMRALGSGFVIDPAGYIVTNNHVIDGAQKITVTLASGKNYKAKLIGRDARTDLALLKIDADGKLPYEQFGDSDKMRVGDWVLAVGNPFGLGGTVTAGIVSARGRHLEGDSIVDFIQTDAPINRGNSGGPTFNEEGEVIGVNTAIYSPNGGSVGLGFAIPSNVVKKVVADLREHGKVNRGWLGVQIQGVTPDLAESLGLKEPQGALVASVVPDSPAAKAGFKSGDVILKWNGTKVEDAGALVRLVAGGQADEKSKAEIWRDGSEKTIAVVTGTPPKNEQVAEGSQPGQNGGETPSASHEALGLGVQDLTAATRQPFNVPDDVKGVVVASVDDNGAASEQGIQPGDVVESVALKPVTSASDFVAKVKAAEKAGKKVVTLKVVHQGNARYVALRTAQA
ncbi:MAG: DegQ family serine endoprotease [Candidatus Eiseniibacteriota bacterium]